jgi:Zn-dependent peptidase ImmA (M78 family)
MTSRRELLQLQPDVLRWARERADLTTDALAHKVGLKTERVLDWEDSGKISMSQAERLAHATHTPLGYLFLTWPPIEPIPIQDFRTRANALPEQPSPDLLETIYTMQRRQDWMREELIDTGAEPLEFVGSYHPNGNYGAVADAMRDALLLADDWAASLPTSSDTLGLLRDNAETAGILVVFNGVVGNNTSRALNPDEFQGFALVDEYAPLVFVNNADFKAAQMFTLAHELAHLFIGEEGVSTLESLLPSEHYVEQLCNKIAAEFLIPEADFRTFWSLARQSQDPYQQTARHFKVSRIVAARRALDLELIDMDAFFVFYNDNKAQGHRSRQTTDGGNFWNTQRWRIGPRFAAAVARAVKVGRLPYREAYALTGLSGTTFANMPEKMGIRL